MSTEGITIIPPGGTSGSINNPSVPPAIPTITDPTGTEMVFCQPAAGGVAQMTSGTLASLFSAELPSLVVEPSATYAALPANPIGLFLVLADETKGGEPTMYLFTSAHRYWFAMVQDA